MKFGRSPIPEWRCEEIRAGSPITPQEHAAHKAWIELRGEAMREAGLKGVAARLRKGSLKLKVSGEKPNGE